MNKFKVGDEVKFMDKLTSDNIFIVLSKNSDNSINIKDVKLEIYYERINPNWFKLEKKFKRNKKINDILE